jgi:PAS domain S-box-containing protein
MTASGWNREHRSKLFDEIPSAIFVVDRSLSIVDHNRAFGAIFGDSLGEPCYKVLKERPEPCPLCAAEKTFVDGTERVLEQRGMDRSGLPVDCLVQLTPIQHNGTEVDYVAAITTDLTTTKSLQREYQTLFEKVPCYVAVINRDLRVVRANERFRKTFGEPMGERCYRLFKQRGEPCPGCPVEKTFADGASQTVHHVGAGRDGKATHYLASTAPLLRNEGEITHVIHMSLDTTEVHDLEVRLHRADALREALLGSSLDAILVCDDKEKIRLVNPAAEELWGFPADALIGRKAPPHMIPKPLKRVLKGKKDWVLEHEVEVTTRSGEQVAVRAAAVRLPREGPQIGTAVMVHDLREVKALERGKLEAERLAAVGQTVAGLAHGIKNILTGLEGGMYVTSSGLKKKDDQRINQGWGMLQRNIRRISDLAKNLLAFSRGDQPHPKLTDPARIVEDVVELYRDRVRQHGITLQPEIELGIAPAWLDPEGIHSCLANLVSNAMDACLVSDNPGCTISIRLREEGECLIFEVADTGCGMDYELKQKVFTSFLTTKGKGGTGIGLLITKKIVQQHGGEVTVVSEPGEGSTFRLTFPRRRLPQPKPKGDRND